jgi:hypothetical protein
LEEIRELRGRQVCEPLVWFGGADEDVAWKEGLDVDQSEGVRCCEKDLDEN